MDIGDVGVTGSLDDPVESQNNGSETQTLNETKFDDERSISGQHGSKAEVADTTDIIEQSATVVEDSSLSGECPDVVNSDQKNPAQVEEILKEELGEVPAAQDSGEDVGKEEDLDNEEVAEANLNEPAENVDTEVAEANLNEPAEAENIDTTPTEVAAEESQPNLSLPTNVQMVQAKTEDGGIKTVPKYEKGMKVLYKNSSGIIEGCIIMDVHLDDMLEPYYTIKLEDGREKQTDNAHIMLKPQDEEKGGGNGGDDGDRTKEHLDREIQFVATQTNESTTAQHLDREILFDTSIPNMKAFHQLWASASDKALSFTAPVLRVSPGRFFLVP